MVIELPHFYSLKSIYIFMEPFTLTDIITHSLHIVKCGVADARLRPRPRPPAPPAPGPRPPATGPRPRAGTCTRVNILFVELNCTRAAGMCITVVEGERDYRVKWL